MIKFPLQKYRKLLFWFLNYGYNINSMNNVNFNLLFSVCSGKVEAIGFLGPKPSKKACPGAKGSESVTSSYLLWTQLVTHI